MGIFCNDHPPTVCWFYILPNMSRFGKRLKISAMCEQENLMISLFNLIMCFFSFFKFLITKLKTPIIIKIERKIIFSCQLVATTKKNLNDEQRKTYKNEYEVIYFFFNIMV
jgi:hypothetical protein